MSNSTYPQQPYTSLTEAEYNKYVGKIKTIDFSAIYDGVDNLDAEGERYCSNDVCLIETASTADIMDEVVAK